MSTEDNKPPRKTVKRKRKPPPHPSPELLRYFETSPDDATLTARQVSDLLHVRRRTLNGYERNPDLAFPKFFTLTPKGAHLWYVGEIRAWMAAHKKNGGA